MYSTHSETHHAIDCIARSADTRTMIRTLISAAAPYSDAKPAFVKMLCCALVVDDNTMFQVV